MIKRRGASKYDDLWRAVMEVQLLKILQSKNIQKYCSKQNKKKAGNILYTVSKFHKKTQTLIVYSSVPSVPLYPFWSTS